MERGNTKHGPAHDEQMAQETAGMVHRGAQRGPVEEWRETEPVEDSVPPVVRQPPDPDIRDRSELARVMTRDLFPATRGKLQRRLADAGTPPELAERVAGLPEDTNFASVHEVFEALGISSPETR